jgi:hypothetical protein
MHTAEVTVLSTGMHVLPAIRGNHRPVAAARTRPSTQTNPTLRRAAGAYCFVGRRTAKWHELTSGGARAMGSNIDTLPFAWGAA